MKKIVVVISLLLTVFMLFGCKPMSADVSTNTGNNNVYQSAILGTLQGKIMDALTGAPIGGSDLQVYLIQGATDRGPDKLRTDPNDVLCGEYAFANIPIDVDQNDIDYKIVVIKAGYQRFEADISFDTSYSGSNVDIVNYWYNRIGNIYLFPLGATSGDVNIYVYNSSKVPVSGAFVILRQNVANNSETAYTGDRLAPTGGLITSLTGTTDTSGKVTFSSSNLTLGGSYSVRVEALKFQGEELSDPATAAFTVGTNSSTRVINMTTIGNVLFATSASNQAPGVTASGVLSVTFNQPVLLSSLTCTATLSGGSGAVFSSGTTTSAGYTAVLSSGNQTITMTPAFATGATAKGATLTWDCGAANFLILQNSQVTTAFTLFTAPVTNIVTGQAVSGVVQLTSK